MNTNFESKEYFEQDFDILFKYNDDSCFPNFHFHDSLEIFYCVAGGKQYFIDDTIYSLNPGDLFIVNNYEIHKPIRNENKNYERIIALITPEKIKQIAPQHASFLLSCFISRKPGEHNKIELSDTAKKQFVSLTKKIHELNPTEVGFSALKEAYFIELLVLVNRWYQKNFSPNTNEGLHGLNPTIKEIIDYLNDNFTNQISLNDLENKFHINKYYLCQLFKKATGTTIHRYVVARRLSRSKILLTQGHSVTETSALSGFQNYTHFIRTFKKHFGISPKQFVKSI